MAGVEANAAAQGPPDTTYGFAQDRARLRSRALRVAIVCMALLIAFSGVAAQLVRLGMRGPALTTAAVSRPLSETFLRPDLVDRKGQLLATDVALPSLFADPTLILGVDETLEQLETVLPGISRPALRRALSNRRRRFVWVRRALSPATAQRIHELGLPGLSFRLEPKRSYPRERLAGHIIGSVNIDNRGTSGLERHVDRKIGVRRLIGEPVASDKRVRLTLDIAVQNALEQELNAGRRRYGAVAASGVILDAVSGAVRGAASLPLVDPANPGQAMRARNLDRLMRGTYELGSVFKALTIAMALEKRIVTRRTVFDVRQPIDAGRHKIRDFHSAGRPLTVEEIFVHSSNIGAALLATEVGTPYQRDFLGRFGLLDPLKTEAGETPQPLVPRHWGRTETMTISYGHGIAVAPLQFAAAAATLVNGGFAVRPTFLADNLRTGPGKRLISGRTSKALRQMMRLNVMAAGGSGRRADVAGYEVGGKTGTADRAEGGRYAGRSVITSFLAAFPMQRPRFVLLVTLHDPKPTGERQLRTAGTNAAPVAGRIIARVAPLLDVMPARPE